MKVKVTHLIDVLHGDEFFTVGNIYSIICLGDAGFVEVLDDTGTPNILFDSEYEVVEE